MPDVAPSSRGTGLRATAVSFTWSRATARAAVLSMVGVGVAGISGVGCGGGSGQKLEVKKIDASVKPPANVALYVKIARDSGEPVSLIADDFSVYEDGKLVSSKKARRALLPVKQAVDRFLLVAVDFTGPLADSEYLPILLEAIEGMAARLGKHTRIGVSAFDGEGLMPFVAFDDTDIKAGLAAMQKFRARDRNVDLWGSIIAYVDALEEVAAKSPLRHRQPTLLVVTDRRDKAQRLTPDQAAARIKKTAAEVVVVGVGPEASKEELEPLGKTGFHYVGHQSEIDKPFEKLTASLEATLLQDYLFSYCSPKRKGKHEVELRISSPRWRGSVEHEFSAKGFGSECDPAAKPDFAAAEAPAPGGEGEGDAEDEAKSKKKKKKKKAADEEEAAPAASES